MKKVLITGVTGQDGSYLAELLLDKGYEVHALVRRSSNFSHPHIEKIKNDIILHNGDLTDENSIRNSIINSDPDEVYNLAAQSHVGISFNLPDLTGEINALGALKVLESIREIKPQAKYYQASTSEMFGMTNHKPQIESTIFYPHSPYAVAKVFAYWITLNYREAYNMFACNGILFNHESPRRGENFVTRKITKGFANIIKGNQNTLELGNLDSSRDWGHAKDYVRAMWLMLQQDKPSDYIVAMEESHTIRDFCNACAKYFSIELEWSGSLLEEKAIDTKTGQTIIKINPTFYRPIDGDTETACADKAHKILGWKPEYTFETLVAEMCENDLRMAT